MTPDELAALCAQSLPDEHLTVAELTRLCYGPGDMVIGDGEGAAVWRVQRYGDHVAAWLLLVAVRPDRQDAGRGKALVAEVLDRARGLGARSAHLAGAAPRYVWPGVEIANTRAGMLCETFGFERDLVAVNMSIPTTFRRDPPPGIVVEREHSGGARDLARRAYPHWLEELEVALATGTAFAARDERGRTVGFGCHSCNRTAWVGPMATDPDVQHRGVGSAVLAAVCDDLRTRGHSVAEIAWVSNLRFYGKCGARVSRAFQGGQLRL